VITMMINLTFRPVVLCMLTVGQCLAVGVKRFRVVSDSWGRLMLIIVYFGGVLVLFIYICRIAQLDKIRTTIGLRWIVVPVIGVRVDLMLVKISNRGFNSLGPRGVVLFIYTI